MTATAERISGNLPGKAGETYAYALSAPYHGIDHVIVSRIDMSAWGLRETRVVPAALDESGIPIMLTDGDNTMSMSIPMALCSHAEALESIGYTEVVPEPVDPPDEAA